MGEVLQFMDHEGMITYRYPVNMVEECEGINKLSIGLAADIEIGAVCCSLDPLIPCGEVGKGMLYSYFAVL